MTNCQNKLCRQALVASAKLGGAKRQPINEAVPQGVVTEWAGPPMIAGRSRTYSPACVVLRLPTRENRLARRLLANLIARLALQPSYKSFIFRLAQRFDKAHVLPDDVIVVDDDGAALIPAALIDEVVRAAPDQERFEAWIMEEIEQGIALSGLYPPSEETKARYEAIQRQSK